MAEQMSQGPGYENFMDFYDAARGFLAEMKESIVKKGDGAGSGETVVWDINRFDKAWANKEIQGEGNDKAEITRLFATIDKTLPDFEIVLQKKRRICV